MAVIETQLKKSGRGEWDLSEKNMVNHRGDDVTYNVGGRDYTASGYLLRGSGPVLEEYDVYVGNTNDWPRFPSPALVPAFLVQDIVWVPPLNGTEESRAILKAAIREHGAVDTAITWVFDSRYEQGANYYYTGAGDQNHAITVVGWDDDYSASNFATTPPGNGAWIIKNSWGTRMGDKGYYYISYHDTQFGKHSNGYVYIPAPEGGSYDAVHGYDCAGPDYDTSNPTEANPVFSNDLQAVVFTAAGESLAAVGVWTRLYPKPYEITIYTNVTRGANSPTADGVLAHVQTGTLTRPGYTTIPLSTEIPLAAGTGYAVVYRQTGDETISTPVSVIPPAKGIPIYGGYRFTRGNCYVGWTEENGTVTWQDAYDAGIYARDTYSWALCIKAYTHNATTPTGDSPGASEDGTKMLVDMAMHHPELFNESFSFGSLAGLGSANGRSLWAKWLMTGFDPAIPEDKEFSVSIDMSSGSPSITWAPDLGASRTYKVFGRNSLAPEDTWREVDRDNPAADGARFFRVSVNQ